MVLLIYSLCFLMVFSYHLRYVASKRLFLDVSSFESSSACYLLALVSFCNYDVKEDSFKGYIWEDLKRGSLYIGGLILRQNPCFLPLSRCHRYFRIPFVLLCI